MRNYNKNQSSKSQRHELATVPQYLTYVPRGPFASRSGRARSRRSGAGAADAQPASTLRKKYKKICIKNEARTEIESSKKMGSLTARSIDIKEVEIYSMSTWVELLR
ncbi:hypothetical protein EVAR_6746_1 [Eumeta japonica]|uniref:Uncharacterized protein n=1 Tax=Eumeta variegata TaxID=151549 RepID=A0A4C1V3L8_EUMVA|nr:hypothetical protein EVAR_6746_1 [Eumeta japonica]